MYAELRIQVRQRLVHQEHRRATHDGAAERDALALATRELLRSPFQQTVDLQQAGDFADAGSHAGFRQTANAQRIREIFVHRQVWIQGVALEHHSDVARTGWQLVDDRPANTDGAAADALETGQHPQAGGLAAAGWTQQHQQLTLSDFKVQLVDSQHVAERLAHLLEGNRRVARLDFVRHPVTPPSVSPRMM